MTKDLINTAREIIKIAYKNKGRIPYKESKIFYTIPVDVRLRAQRYVHIGLI